MSLAKRLLEPGERDAVMRYIEMSAEISDEPKERDKRRAWMAVLKNDQVPEFERFMDYKHE